MSGTVLGDVVVLCRFYLTAKPSHVGVDKDGLSCPLHRPIVCNCHMREQSFLLGAVIPSCHSGRCVFLGGAKPLGLDI
jgi:hypothetical protein